MSRKKQMLEIEPERNLSNETLSIGGFNCPACDGNGYRWTYDESAMENVRIKCAACDGLHKVKAIIEIKWEPDK